MKPPRARCTTPWPVGTVAGVQSQQRLEVNGIPRHVSDLRRVPGEETKVEEEEDSVCRDERPRRERRRPTFFGNNIFYSYLFFNCLYFCVRVLCVCAFCVSLPFWNLIVVFELEFG